MSSSRRRAARRDWAGQPPAGPQTEVLIELASTTVGAHFALNNVFLALLAGLALKRLTIDDIAGAVAINRSYAPDPATRGVYGELYREFRAIHKQTKGIYARLNRHATCRHIIIRNIVDRAVGQAVPR